MEPAVSLCPNPVQTDVIRNISELPDDVLMKILSLLPTKEAAATSVLSKRWSCLWNQQDVDYVVLCEKCCADFVSYMVLHSPKVRHRLLSSYLRGKNTLVRVPPPPPEKVGFARLISCLTGESRLRRGCTECKERIHAPRKVTIFILRKLGESRKKTGAFIWTKVEGKQEIRIEFVNFGKTIANYCVSLDF